MLSSLFYFYVVIVICHDLFIFIDFLISKVVSCCLCCRVFFDGQRRRTQLSINQLLFAVVMLFLCFKAIIFLVICHLRIGVLKFRLVCSSSTVITLLPCFLSQIVNIILLVLLIEVSIAMVTNVQNLFRRYDLLIMLALLSLVMLQQSLLILNLQMQAVSIIFIHSHFSHIWNPWSFWDLGLSSSVFGFLYGRRIVPGIIDVSHTHCQFHGALSLYLSSCRMRHSFRW